VVALCTITQQPAINLPSENVKNIKAQQNVTVSFVISEILEAGGYEKYYLHSGRSGKRAVSLRVA
jgi:hypothetical protein